jgi:hypothetical protein
LHRGAEKEIRRNEVLDGG